MALVSVARYSQITGDTLTTIGASDAGVALRDAQELLEQDLRRPLEAVERTERLALVSEGCGLSVFPSALPLVSAAGHTIDGPALVGSFTFDSFDAWTQASDRMVEVTYVGGFQARDADPDVGAETVPASVERDIAWAAYVLARPEAMAALAMHVGASSVSLGDAALVYTVSGPTKGIPSPSQAGLRWSPATWALRKVRRTG